MKVSVTWSFTATQLPLPVVVSVSVTLPLAISAAVGVYVTFWLVVLGSKLPAPPLQITPVATVKEPLKDAAALFEQRL